MKKTIITILLAVAALTVQAQTKVWDNIVMGYANSLPEDIANTYWRNESTGDWMIGITPNHVIYKNKVWDIVSQTEKKDAYTLTINDGTIIKVGKMKKGQRIITIGKEKPATCSPIVTKLTEPYRGRLVLLDIWGTWCGPCKAALSHSQEEYERLKDYNLVYLYLANRSPEDGWKNVIKEYNVTGENVVHYNLPADQQSAVEHFLQVHSWPTYKLIDRDGKVLDVNADPRNLESLAKLLDLMK